jgi:hypothetical protein
MKFAPLLSAVTLLGLSACSVSTSPTGSSHDALSSIGTNVLYKKLPQALSMPSTPIGATMASVLTGAVANAAPTGTESETPFSGDCATKVWSLAAGRTVESTQCVGNSTWVIYDWQAGKARTYVGGGTLRVEYYVESQPSAPHALVSDDLEAYDSNQDGRLDQLTTRLAPQFQIEGYAAGWVLGADRWYRILEDTDHDGMFDLEGITGDWTCTQATASDCTLDPRG